MKKILLLAVLAAGAAALPGCLLVAGAAIGAGIVHATGEDTAEVMVEVPSDAAYAAAREEIRTRGVLESADSDAAHLEGTVGGSTVKVSVSTPTRGEAKVSVSARKNAGISPDFETAEQVAMAIAKRAQ